MSALIGFDTATADTAVAATRDGEVVFEASIPPAPGSARPLHATALLGAVERAAAELGGWRASGRLAVGVGPGSFTGLRVGIATGRALAQGTGLEIVGVGSLDALSAGVGEAPAARGRARLAVLDARRGEVYAVLDDADGARRWGPILASPETLADRIRELGAAPVAAGDGALRFREMIEGSGALVLEADDRAHRMSARLVCRLGATAKPVAVTALEPIYLRPPDAELWREQQRQRHDRA